MNKARTATRVGAAAFALALSLAGPQAVGVASANGSDTDSASAAESSSAGVSGAASRKPASARTARASRSAAAAGSAARQSAVVRAEVPAPAGERRTSTPAARPRAASATAPVLPADAEETTVAPPKLTSAEPESAPRLEAVRASREIAPATATPSGVLWDINTAVISVFDATQNWLTSLPANPISDLLEGALLLVRRSLFSQPATVDPVQTITTATGQILGTLGAVSPQASPLSYTLTSAPLLGAVEVSPDGTYVYTPGTDFSEYDTFTVAVDSPGFNIFNPTGTWRPAQASVSVWGAPGGPPEGSAAKPLISRTFEIINLTSSNQMLTGWSNNTWCGLQRCTVVSRPPTGTIFSPGETATIVLAQYSFNDLDGVATFGPVDAGGASIAAPSGPFSVEVSTRPFGSLWRCSTGNCDTGELRTVVLLDPPGTVIGLPSGQGQKQADVLNSFCATQRAKCSFTSRSFDNAAWAAPVQSSDSVRNNTTSNLTTTITVTNTQSTATSLKLSTSVKAKVFEVVEVSVTAEASQTWTSTYTFSQAITLTAKPGEEVYVETSAPIKAVTGDFRVALGNTTFNLYDITFDSPDPERRLRYDAIAVPIPPQV